MPPRRSTRATSLKPTEPAAVKKPIPRSKSFTTTKKREASPERTPSPPPKRARTNGVQKPENKPQATTKARKPPSTTAATAAAKKPRAKLSPVPETKSARVPQLKPYFNPLPVPPEPRRPGLQLFAWGAGNFGQFGMGPDVLGELDKPRKNVWVEQKIQEGAFGDDHAGLESAVAGGLHSLFIDEKGTVSVPQYLLSSPLKRTRCGHVVLMTTLP